jgi:short-subunit dehydrogenase
MWNQVEFMLQTPHQVADECLHALGQGKYAIATGPIQKAFRFITKRFLPTTFATDAFSGMIEQNLNENEK